MHSQQEVGGLFELVAGQGRGRDKHNLFGIFGRPILARKKCPEKEKEKEKGRDEDE